MEEAIGAKIDDYLIKPLNPSQILLSVKRSWITNAWSSRKPTRGTSRISEDQPGFIDDLNHEKWVEIYKKLVFWNCKWIRPTIRIWRKCLNAKGGSQLQLLQVYQTQL